ncbi:MAG: phosphatase PAP2 family protein [Aliidiomarina sp.]|uniref:phosphatase PAP2 family protein n=1 Tax=Aliidiomarina sp. TaxID=1872439 RepID=UPI0025C71515|nr:phosphatase PAP2 family protein [Aliidiomarina sp.]MCH8500529.1 phosphatase PAP2 family protein [Aliidiomarina sp.]
MGKSLRILLALSLCSTTVSTVQASETAGDILRVALPAAAWGMSKYAQDDEGTRQFYYSFATTVVSTYALKQVVNKQRPDGSDNDAFPSGHASMAFQGAAFIQRRYGWAYGAPAYALATYIGYTRVDSDKHDTTDVVAGALIGFLSSYYFAEPIHGFQLTPTAQYGSVGLQLTRRF